MVSLKILFLLVQAVAIPAGRAKREVDVGDNYQEGISELIGNHVLKEEPQVLEVYLIHYKQVRRSLAPGSSGEPTYLRKFADPNKFDFTWDCDRNTKNNYTLAYIGVFPSTQDISLKSQLLWQVNDIPECLYIPRIGSKGRTTAEFVAPMDWLPPYARESFYTYYYVFLVCYQSNSAQTKKLNASARDPFDMEIFYDNCDESKEVFVNHFAVTDPEE